ncbi:MAG TPA: hypothetical protein VFT53_01735 [Candidatus Saccharimonadales bacterium]|nr:hypothetical protein [Candidatus Saccharimonadales bacterium]
MVKNTENARGGPRYNLPQQVLFAGLILGGAAVSSVLGGCGFRPSRNAQYAATAQAFEQTVTAQSTVAPLPAWTLEPALDGGKTFTIQLGEVACNIIGSKATVDVVNPVINRTSDGTVTQLGYMADSELQYTAVDGKSCHVYPLDENYSYGNGTEDVQLTPVSSNAAIASQVKTGDVLVNTSYDPIEVAVLAHPTK